MDSRASDHMIGDITQSKKYRPCNEGTMVRVADGTSSAVVGIWHLYRKMLDLI